MKTGKPTTKAARPVLAAPPRKTPPTKSSPREIGAAIPQPSSPEPRGNVRLQFYAPQAREVYVAGSFNQWRPGATAMQSSGGGLWARELALAPGRYEYLFLVDGQWLPDPGAEAFAPNPYGGMNSLLDVAK